MAEQTAQPAHTATHPRESTSAALPPDTYDVTGTIAYAEVLQPNRHQQYSVTLVVYVWGAPLYIYTWGRGGPSI